jgi:hypothetical protein
VLNYASLQTLFEPFGELRSQPESDWRGQTKLPASLLDFYREVGPWGATYHENIGPVGSTLSVGGNPVCIPPLHKLENFQAGYAWSKSPSEALPGWRPEWLVVAEQGGDPFILDIVTGEVLFAFHGAGAWAPKPFAPDLLTAFGSLATVAQAHCLLSDEAFDDCELTEEGRNQITLSLANHLGDRQQAESMLSAWQYYR